MALLCDLPDDILQTILAGAGCRAIASAGTACRRLATVQSSLVRLPVFSGAMSTELVLEEAIQDAAERALAGMLGAVDFAIIVVCKYGKPRKAARGKGMQHAVPLLLNHLQMDIPCVGCVSSGCMGVDAAGLPCEVDPRDRDAQGVSILLGRLPGCCLRAFSCEGPVGSAEWHELEAVLDARPTPELLLLLNHGRQEQERDIFEALQWLRPRLSATTSVVGGVAIGVKCHVGPGSQSSALGRVSSAWPRFVGLALSSCSNDSAEAPPAGPPAAECLATATSTHMTGAHAGHRANARAAGVSTAHMGASSSRASPPQLVNALAKGPAPGCHCSLAAAALSVRGMAPLTDACVYEVELDTVEGETDVIGRIYAAGLEAAGVLSSDGTVQGRLTRDGATLLWQNGSTAPQPGMLLWRATEQVPSAPLAAARHNGAKAVLCEMLDDYFEDDEPFPLHFYVEDRHTVGELLAPGARGRLCMQEVGTNGEANVLLLEEQLPALCGAVRPPGGALCSSAACYGAAAAAAAAAGARSGPQALLAFSCCDRGSDIYGWGPEAQSAQEACLMDAALAGQAPFWGMYAQGELGPWPQGGSCGFGGRLAAQDGVGAGVVSSLEYSGVFAAVGAWPS